jgi:pyridoxal phosphate enzyme (YggS family)
MSIAENLNNLKTTLPDNITLVAVSKTKPIEKIQEAYETGHRIFGENKAQELQSKYPQLPKDIEWHFIGHLQRNKVKYISEFVHTIHSVDSLRLLKEINKQAKKNSRIINCFLQFHIAEEESKFGLNLEKATELLNSEVYKSLQNIKITGVMGMATFTDDFEKIDKEFKTLKNIFEELKSTIFPDNDDFKEISMGMTNDYQIAIKNGSTLLRIGSEIFGAREY